MIPSPPPEYNFATIPTVHGRDELWLRKHPHPHGAERLEAEELKSGQLDVRLAGREVGTGEVGTELPGMASTGELAQVDRAVGAGSGDRHGTGILLRIFGAALGVMGLVIAASVHVAAGLALFAAGFLIFAVFGVYAVGASGGGPVDPPDRTGWTPEGSPDADDDAHHSIHLPDPSYYPLITAFGLTFGAAGFIFGLWLTGVGVIMMLFGIYAWCFEPING